MVKGVECGRGCERPGVGFPSEWIDEHEANEVVRDGTMNRGRGGRA